ncbi:MAG: ilvE 2 [Frankiales bacterium]|nr:ilvE 2 [Frankiales bacterium]
MAQLQQPKYVYMGGGLRPWNEATLHIGTEAVTRSLNVFEGLKGYWQPGGPFGIVQLRQHFARLRRSARLLRIPFDMPYEEFCAALGTLVEALLETDKDMWFRTTLYAVEGHWGEGTVADLVITGYSQPKEQPAPIRLGVSTWRRSPDVSLPARVKAGTNYQVARLARMEGRDQGYQDMVLLNTSGRVAEATGSCIVMVRDGVIYTPPATEGALESITLDVVEALATSAGYRFVRRPIDRTELLIADEIAICGTLAELVIVTSIEGVPMVAQSPILPGLQDRYFRAVRNIEPHPSVELTVLSDKIAAGS